MLFSSTHLHRIRILCTLANTSATRETLEETGALRLADLALESNTVSADSGTPMLTPFARGRGTPDASVIDRAGEFVGQVQFIVNKVFHMYACYMSIAEKKWERRLAFASLIL
ncbi:MAG: hypothetical protein WBP93_16210 [Pyrinomonadaceae bacterium]